MERQHARPRHLQRAAYALIGLLAAVAVMHLFWRSGPLWLDTFMVIWVPGLLRALILYELLELLAGLPPGRRRRAWQAVTIAIAFNLIVSLSQIALGGTRFAIARPFIGLLSLVYYPIAVVAGILFFLDAGGSIRRWTTWLDVLALALGVGVVLWMFLLEPHLIGVGTMTALEWFLLVATMIGNGLVMVIASLLAMNISSWRREWALAILIGSAIVAFVGLTWWTGSIQVDRAADDVGYTVLNAVIPLALLGLAIHFERRRPGPAQESGAPAGPWLTFLPALLVLIVIALLFDQLAHLQGMGRMLLAGFVVAGAVLTGLQHRTLRFELAGLKKAVIAQDVEIGLSELVRRSADLIALVGADQRLAYVSPAALDVVGRPAGTLRLAPASALLGLDNEPRMRRLLDDVAVQRLADAGFTASFVDPQGDTRAVRVVGSCQIDNPDISGIVLTVRDITEEQRLEREVIDCVSRERTRLSSDVHDGVGQELTGIALLLKSLDPDVERNRGSLLRSLLQIEQHVNETIRLTQLLESGLAPLPAGRGTLGSMLEHLVAEARARYGFEVGFEPPAPEVEVSTVEAEHLYRIAQESINNAARHSGCRCVNIRLENIAGHVLLVVEDDGCGIPSKDAAADGLGMRMMEYRARILGASLQVGLAQRRGTRVSVILSRSGSQLPGSDAASGGATA